jgi:hypothetical protein
VDQVVISELFPHPDDCYEEFNADYSYVHLTSGTGQSLDAKIDTAADVDCEQMEGTSCQCTIPLASAELILDGPGGFALGQQVHIEANQTALYRVEEVFETEAAAVCQRSHRTLMRYFVNYDGVSSLGADCDVATITDNLIKRASAKVVAEYVQEFQVWFRTAIAGNTVDMKPNYHTPTELYSADEGFAPCREVPVYEGAPGCNNPSANDLSCEPSPSEYAPQHVRSAVVRLAVRTEKTDMSMKFEDTAVDGGIVRYNIAPPPDPVAYCPDVGVFKVRTLATEVALPNVAARMASFTELP